MEIVGQVDVEDPNILTINEMDTEDEEEEKAILAPHSTPIHDNVPRGLLNHLVGEERGENGEGGREITKETDYKNFQNCIAYITRLKQG